MNTAELREATKGYDLESVGLTGRPLTAAQKAQHRRAKRRPGRPRRGEGVRVISLSVEESLLRRADARAKDEGISRAQLFARGLESVLHTSHHRATA
jgi:hypothetical protein